MHPLHKLLLYGYALADCPYVCRVPQNKFTLMGFILTKRTAACYIKFLQAAVYVADYILAKFGFAHCLYILDKYGSVYSVVGDDI